jgi:hypothetical protein
MCKEEDFNELQGTRHEELLTVYKHTIEDVERVKQWQWRFTYYTVIGQGAVLALYAQYRSIWDYIWLKILFMIIAILIGALGVFLVYRSKRDLEEFRKRMKGCRNYFSKPVKELFEKSEKLPFHEYLILAILVNLFTVVLILHLAK